ncbi:hypothetical protein [Lacisediminihabitans changchengi]|uniref:Flagellar protein FlgN n=1 Tax=Lacisediminihabitans changchengi TaxID=2787634 RepID=A0A934W4L8_9MICO|nr:hypothetical protein [Lacisediminihabitans changchengi]MBK4348409.1 hypothetical protein [Lacisediminihabitans changchengi]
MTDVILDLALLEQLKSDLDAVVREFTNADDFSNDVADATGHDELHSHVEDFAHKWNDKRAKMTENVAALQQQVGAVYDGFSQTDQGLAKALEDAANSGPADYPPVPAKTAANHGNVI